MRTLGIGIVLALVGAAVVLAGQPAAFRAVTLAAPKSPAQAPAAQTDAAMMKTFASAAEVQSLLAKAKAERKEGQVMVAEHILSLAPYVANLEYRPVEGVVAVHEKEAEMVYVIDGGGTLTTGGKVVGEKRTNDANLSGTSIDGGTAQAINKSDFAIIPEGTPHQIVIRENRVVHSVCFAHRFRGVHGRGRPGGRSLYPPRSSGGSDDQRRADRERPGPRRAGQSPGSGRGRIP
jgi:quercetin dioxygenase-like cupin family protein